MKLEPYTTDIYKRTVKLTSNTNKQLVIYIDTDVSNCKLSYIHGAGSLSIFSDKDKKKAIDLLLESCKGYVILNTTNKFVSDFIFKNYHTYFYQEVPVGYAYTGNKFQYVISFRNNIKVNSNCKEIVANCLLTKTKESIKDKLINLLKFKRRKLDIVDDILKLL